MKQKITLRARAGKWGARGVRGFVADRRVPPWASRAKSAARARPPKPAPARSRNSRREAGRTKCSHRPVREEVMASIKQANHQGKKFQSTSRNSSEFSKAWQKSTT